MEVVGAKGFEPSTSWSRTRRAKLHKNFRFNIQIEKQEVNFRSRVCVGVSGCAHLLLGSLQNPLQPLAHTIL